MRTVQQKSKQIVQRMVQRMSIVTRLLNVHQCDRILGLVWQLALQIASRVSSELSLKTGHEAKVADTKVGDRWLGLCSSGSSCTSSLGHQAARYALVHRVLVASRQRGFVA